MTLYSYSCRSTIARSHVRWSLLLDASVLQGPSLGPLLPSAAAGSRPGPAAAAAPHLAATGSPSWAQRMPHDQH